MSGVAIFEVRDSRSSRDPNFLPVFVTFWNVLRADHVRICFYRVFLFRFLTTDACDQILQGPKRKKAPTRNSNFRFPAETRRNGLVRAHRVVANRCTRVATSTDREDGRLGGGSNVFLNANQSARPALSFGPTRALSKVRHRATAYRDKTLAHPPPRSVPSWHSASACNSAVRSRAARH